MRKERKYAHLVKMKEFPAISPMFTLSIAATALELPEVSSVGKGGAES
jgi:hypothetical protein